MIPKCSGSSHGQADLLVLLTDVDGLYWNWFRSEEPNAWANRDHQSRLWYGRWACLFNGTGGITKIKAALSRRTEFRLYLPSWSRCHDWGSWGDQGWFYLLSKRRDFVPETMAFMPSESCLFGLQVMQKPPSTWKESLSGIADAEGEPFLTGDIVTVFVKESENHLEKGRVQFVHLLWDWRCVLKSQGCLDSPWWLDLILLKIQPLHRILEVNYGKYMNNRYRLLKID